ncbi:MAG: GGDEF domain-containing protein [Bacillota bacterium]
MSNDPTLWSAFPIFSITAVCGAFLAVLMLIMCLLMYSKQRKKAYIYMAAAFFFIMTYESLNIHQAFSGRAWQPSGTGMRSLQLFSFILLNLSVLLLYRRTRKVHYGLPAITAVMLLTPLFLPSSINPVWPDLYLTVIEWFVIYLSFSKIAPRIGQRFKYSLGLFIYSIWASIHIIYKYLSRGDEPGLLLQISAVLPLVFYSIIFFILFQRIIELMQSIYRSSITDGLTGLYNRRYFMKHLNHYVSNGTKISAIFCDIDNFKMLNDTQGHAHADEVLQQVATIMEEELDGIGITGRYGGEELVAIVARKGSKVSQVAENIRFRISEETIVTVSVGYSTLRKGVTADNLMKQADQAMYHSKSNGKNRVTDYRSIRAGSRTSDEAANLGSL